MKRRRSIPALLGLMLLTAAAARGQTLAIADAGVFEGDTGQTNAVFTVTLSGVTPFQVTVDYSTSDLSATAFDDYQPTSGTLTFSSAQPQQILVSVHGDHLVEGNEIFLVRLSNATNATLIDSDGLGTIFDDDAAAISIADVTLTEGDTGSPPASFAVTLSAPVAEPVTVSYATRDGSATVADGDYQADSGTLTFAPEQTTQTLVVSVLGDFRLEPDETFFVDLTDPTNAGLADAEGRGTIVNDDQAAPQLSIDDVAVSEGDAGAVDATFTVSLSVAFGAEVTVDYATRDGSATVADGDYQAASGTLTFAPGQTTRTLAVSVLGDSRVEPDETFFVDLADPTNATLAVAQGQGTIGNDDQQQSRIRLVSAPAAREDAGSATVTVERTGGTAGAARVTVRASAGSAQAGEDFTVTSRVLQWAAGEGGEKTFELEILDDNLEEGDETVRLTLADPVGSALGSPRQLDLVILDDDTPMAVALIGDAQLTAFVNQQVELRVRVATENGSPVAAATVVWTVVQGEAELLDGERTQTDSEGFAVQRLELGLRPGEVIVTAEVEGTDESVQFSVTVRGNLAAGIDPLLEPGDFAVAQVLDSSCADATGELSELCGYLFSLDPADQAAAIAQLTPEEIGAQGTIALAFHRTQFRNIGSRLAALRGGATDQAVDQLAFNLRGQGIQVASLAGVWRPAERFAEQLAWALDAASPDEPGVAGSESGSDPELPGASRWGLFVNGNLSIGDRPTTRKETGFDFETLGLTAGIDYLLNDRVILGGALGYLDADTDLIADGGTMDARGYSLSAYGSYYLEKLYVDAFLSWGSTELDLVRNVDLPQPFLGQQRFVARGSPDSQQFSLGLSGGYNTNFGAYSLGGFGRLSYTEAEIDGYAEQGAGPFNLVIGGQDVESLLADVGLELTYAASRSWGVLQPAVSFSWLHEFEDDTRLIRGRFAEDRTANEFLIPTEEPDRDFFNFSAGLTATFARGRTLYLIYDTDLERDDLNVYTVTAGFRLEL